MASVDSNGRMEVKVLGRIIGTASGWDVLDDHILCFYAFEPSIEYASEFKEDECLTISFETGMFTYEHEGNTTEHDIIHALKEVESSSW